MITGDNPLTACHVATELSITRPNHHTLVYTEPNEHGRRPVSFTPLKLIFSVLFVAVCLHITMCVCVCVCVLGSVYLSVLPGADCWLTGIIHHEATKLNGGVCVRVCVSVCVHACAYV